MRGLWVIVCLLICFSSNARGAFKVELKDGRPPIAAVGVASINHQGIVFSPALGQSDITRYNWDEFSGNGLLALEQILPKELPFRLKTEADRKLIMKFLYSEMDKIAAAAPPVRPPPIAPQTLPAQPIKPAPAEVAQQPKPTPAAPIAVAALPQPTLPPSPVTNNQTPSPPPAEQPASSPVVPAFQLIEAGDFERPPASGASGIFSPAGIFFLLIIAGLSVYAGSEIAKFRNRPVSLVCAVSALLPVLGPTIFLLMPDPAARRAGAIAEASDPLLIKQPGTATESAGAETETPTPIELPEIQYEDDLDSPYLNMNLDETYMAPTAEQAATPEPAALEHYCVPEYVLDYNFFNKYFQRFVNARPETGEELVLRTAELEYPVYYITQLQAHGLGVVYPAGNEWAEESIEYTQLEEVEVRRPSA